jgi:hypothetical protein
MKTWFWKRLLAAQKWKKMDRTIKIFLIMAVIAETMEATGRFTIIPDEIYSSIIMTGMVIPRIPGADVITVHSRCYQLTARKSGRAGGNVIQLTVSMT